MSYGDYDPFWAMVEIIVMLIVVFLLGLWIGLST